jgi:hypothetical protein
MTNRPSISRRHVLGSGAALALSTLGGCWLTKKLKPLCPGEIAPGSEGKGLAIDVHTHVFNATDLQVSEFVSRVAARQHGGLQDLAKYLGPVLQKTLWDKVPDGQKEMRALLDWNGQLGNCRSTTLDQHTTQLRDEGYQNARAALNAAAERVTPAARAQAFDSAVALEALPTPEAQGIRAIRTMLPPTLEGFEAQKAAADLAPLSRSLRSVLEFVVEQFQYRYVSTLQYLKTYRSDTRSIDLVVASLVDYDWWLAGGKPTATSLEDQARVMAELCVATGGRAHAFVPFCPYREVVHRANPADSFSSLAFVQKVMKEYGAVGVKLYPPMGFAALGNAGLSVWSDKNWLSSIAHKPDFGVQLDKAMRDFFQWCVDEHIPVMAHTRLSNGAADDLEALAGFQYWRNAFAEFPTLNVSFGHFGGDQSGELSPNTEGFLGLLESASGAAGSRAFADAGYFAELIESPPQFTAQLRTLFERDAQGKKVLPRRFMFGSDWKMLLVESHSNRYFNLFEALLKGFAQSLGPGYARLPDDVFARNAADFLMLNAGEPGHVRARDFYRKRGVKDPLWMEKLARL